MAWGVAIEWDGRTPPTTYYKRLRKLGIYVRGGKDVDPIERRTRWQYKVARESNGTVEDLSFPFQEGFILTPSETLARTIMRYAEEEGAGSVALFYLEPDQRKMSAEDERIFERLEDNLGRRGRKPKGSEDQEWAVTCRDEGITVNMTGRFIPSCPVCHSTGINPIPGKVESYALKGDGTIIEKWFDHRFARGVFEVPGLDQSAQVAPSGHVDSDRDKLVTRLMGLSPRLIEQVERLASLDVKSALRALDLVFLGRAYASQKAREHGRIMAVTELYKAGVPPTEVSIFESATDYDLIDGAYLDNAQVTELLTLWRAARKPD